MVNPVSSNASNRQGVNLLFDNYDEMQNIAAKYNISNPSKWSERLRLVTLGTLFKRECLSVIGDIFDIGFIHDFGDDDVSFRVRRAGYKTMLASDTWVHHAHEIFNYNAERLEKGRYAFQNKYNSIDAWNDVNNFIDEFIGVLNKPDADVPKILGVDVRCGTPILEVKNKLREYDIFEAETFAFTTSAKYYLDLQTVCGTNNVECNNIDNLLNFYNQEQFDYIVVGENINSYSEPFLIIKRLCKLLAKKGQLFVYLKNTYDIFSFLNSIGYTKIYNKNYSLNYSLEHFFEKVSEMGVKIDLLCGIPYDTNMISQSDVDFVYGKLEKICEADIKETMFRLTVDKYGFVISKE